MLWRRSAGCTNNQRRKEHKKTKGALLIIGVQSGRFPGGDKAIAYAAMNLERNGEILPAETVQKVCLASLKDTFVEIP